MSDDMPTMRQLGLAHRGGQGARKKMLADGHDLACWRHHPECALTRARDIERIRRDHAAGRAQVYADTAARAAHMNPVQRWTELGEVVAQARAMLEAEQEGSERIRRQRGLQAWG